MVLLLAKVFILINFFRFHKIKIMIEIDKSLQKLFTFVKVDGFSCRDVRSYLKSLTSVQVQSILDQCLKFTESGIRSGKKCSIKFWVETICIWIEAETQNSWIFWKGPLTIRWKKYSLFSTFYKLFFTFQILPPPPPRTASRVIRAILRRTSTSTWSFSSWMTFQSGWFLLGIKLFCFKSKHSFYSVNR